MSHAGDRSPEASLGLLDATMVGIGAMIGAGIFVLTGLAAETAGPAAVLVFVLNGGVTLFTALSYAELASAIPRNGGGYAYVRETFSGVVSFVMGWTRWFTYMAAGGLYALGFSSNFVEFVHLYVPSAPNLPVVYALGIVALFVALNALSTEASGGAETVITVLKIVILGVFVAFGVFAVESGEFSPLFPVDGGAITVLPTMGLTFIAFQGYDLIATVTEEVENPQKNIPRAIFLSLAVTVVIYLLVVVVAVGTLGADELGAAGETAVAQAAESFMPTFPLIGNAAAPTENQFGAVQYSAGEPTVDWAAALDGTAALVERFRQTNYVDVAEHYDADIYEGYGKLLADTTIEVVDGPDEGARIVGEKALVATGGSPWEPPIDGLDGVDYYTSETILDGRDLPESIVVIGGGYIALEWGQILHRVGVDVTILQRSERVLSGMEGQLGREMQRAFEEEGIEVITGNDFQRVRTSATDGASEAIQSGVVVETAVDGTERTVTGDALFVATGVQPNSEDIGLDSVGVETNDDGTVHVDEHFQTTNPDIYAAEDVIGEPELETVAAKEGNHAVKNAFGSAERSRSRDADAVSRDDENSRREFSNHSVGRSSGRSPREDTEGISIDYDAVPAVVFTSPEVAAVGTTERKYMDEHGTCSCRTVQMEDVLRAKAVENTDGLVQVVKHHETDEIVGVHMVGPRAADMIMEATLAVKFGLTVDDIIDTVHPFPTFSEAFKHASGWSPRSRGGRPRRPARGVRSAGRPRARLSVCPRDGDTPRPDSGGGKAADRGILMRSGDAFQIFPDVDHIVLDKTGTITVGEPAVSEVVGLDAEERNVLATATSAEAFSEHPLADAILKATDEQGVEYGDPDAFSSVTGKGVRATVNGDAVLVGKPGWLSDEGVDLSNGCEDIERLQSLGLTVSGVVCGGDLIGLIGIGDEIKADAAATVRGMRDAGITPVMITGDNERTAEAVAEEVGIDRVMADVLPHEKREEVGRLQEAGHRVAMVGDGINDAPALTQADIGIAIDAGTDIAIESADIVLMSDRLGGVMDAHEIGTESYRKTRQNLGTAFAFNGIGVAAATTGLVHPIFAMVLSVSAVLANSFAGQFLSGEEGVNTEFALEEHTDGDVKDSRTAAD